VLLALLLRAFGDNIRDMGNSREIDERFGRSVSEGLAVEDLRALRTGHEDWLEVFWLGGESRGGRAGHDAFAVQPELLPAKPSF
jgi:hypothetical protein